jgi:polyisoprenoid-binding protein YceI
LRLRNGERRRGRLPGGAGEAHLRGMSTTHSAEKSALWTLDPAHTTVAFSVRHLMITNVHGVFEKVAGTVRYDPEHPEAAEVSIDIAAASVHTREPQRDAHLRSADFFDAEAHPSITFRSTQVRGGGAAPLAIDGDLTIRGTTRGVTLAVNEITGEHRDFQGARRFGASATAKVRRSEFGITFNKVLETGGVALADEVSLSFDVSLVEVR